MKKRIPFEELSRYSPWPARLAGVEPWELKLKTRESLYREYNDEKYGKLLTARTMEEALEYYWGDGLAEMAYSRHGELFAGTRAEAHVERNQLLIDSLRPLLQEVECVVELGAGFGQIIYLLQQEYPHLRYVAGECMPNALVLGKRLLPNVEFEYFDLFGDWSILDHVENALVLTVHTVEMLSDASTFVHHMQKRMERVRSVVNFEPLYEEDGTALGQLRRRYIEMNGYCKNIAQTVPATLIERDFFGLNPLFPESRIEWKP
jgi:hypothetical protein